jgi:hypothetical protein
LTPAGREAIETAAPGHVDAVRKCFVDLLDDAQVDAMTAIAARVTAAAMPGGADCSADEAACDTLAE